jgi:hypothetical protein
VRRALLLAALAGFALVSVSPGAEGASDDLRILNLRVAGGSGWHPSAMFRLEWDQMPDTPMAPAAHYRLYDASGNPVGPPVRHEEVNMLQQVVVPRPGIYRVDVWLEASNGETGPPVSTTLRFDDVPPGTSLPSSSGGWVAGDEPAFVELGHPSSVPISGIRGYAISVDRGEGSSPCSNPVCGGAEIDAPGGIEDDVVSLGPLPEGLNYVRAVAVSGSGVRSRQVGSAEVYVDATRPEVSLHGAPSGWASGPVAVTVVASDSLSGMTAAGADGPFTAVAVDGAAPTRSEGGVAAAVVAGEGIHEVVFYARDAAGNVADGRAGSPAPASAAVRIDGTPPRVAFARAQDPLDPELIEATVTDALSGPAPSRGSIAVRPSNSRGPFEELPTAASGGRLQARWDSDAYPAGNYEFRVTGYDLAGNVARGDRRATGIKMVLTNPLKGRVTISSGFGAERMRWHRCRKGRNGRRCRKREIESFEFRPGRIRVPYGRGISFGGQTLGAAGQPLSGLPILVTETFAEGASPIARTTLLRTDERGRFKTRLAAGPSRDVVASFAGTRLLGRASGPPVHLGVLTSLQLRASASTANVGGAPVVFRGKVASTGARIPPGGRPVALQFRYPGAGWSEFRTVQTNARGRFSYPYSFSDDDSRGVRFQFRAYVPAMEGWPYEPAVSRPLFVTGR